MCSFQFIERSKDLEVTMENKGINQVIQEAIQEINFEEIAKEAAISKIKETVREAVLNQLKSYSGFGEKLSEHLKSQLCVDLSQIRLPAYREFLIKAVNGALAAYTTQEHANEITKYINEQVVGESRDEITFSTFWNEVCVKIKDTCAEEDSEKYVVECKRSNHSWSGGRGYWDLTVTSGERATQTNRHTSTIISVHFSDGVIYSTHVNDSFELSTLSTWFKALQFRKTKITDIAEETASIPEGY